MEAYELVSCGRSPSCPQIRFTTAMPSDTASVCPGVPMFMQTSSVNILSPGAKRCVSQQLYSAVVLREGTDSL